MATAIRMRGVAALFALVLFASAVLAEKPLEKSNPPGAVGGARRGDVRYELKYTLKYDLIRDIGPPIAYNPAACSGQVKNYVVALTTENCWTDTNGGGFLNPVNMDADVACSGSGSVDVNVQRIPSVPEHVEIAVAGGSFIKDEGYPATIEWDVPTTGTVTHYEMTVTKEAKFTYVFNNQPRAEIQDCPFRDFDSAGVRSFASGSSTILLNQTVRVDAVAGTTHYALPLSFLCPGYVYAVQVKACNEVGCSEPGSDETPVAPVAPFQVQPAPSITAGEFSFPALPVGTPATLSTFATPYDGGRPLTTYIVNNISRVAIEGNSGACPPLYEAPVFPAALDASAASNPALIGSLCPGFTYSFNISACTKGETDDCMIGAASNAFAVTVPAVAPICGIPAPPAQLPLSASYAGYSAGTYGGQSVKNVQFLDALISDTDEVFTDYAISLMGFKDAFIFWPSMTYSGGADVSKFNLTLYRYIRGSNGYAPDKYQNFWHAGNIIGARNYAPVFNIQPSHCYAHSIKLCNSVGCCVPSTNPPAASVNTITPTWYQPSQNYANKKSTEPTDRTFCVSIKPIGATDAPSTTTTKSIGAGIDFGTSMGADAGSAAAGSAARSTATAGTSNTLLAVAIAVPVGVAGIALGAVAAALIVTRKQVRVAVMAGQERAARYAVMPPPSMGSLNGPRTVSVRPGSTADLFATSEPGASGHGAITAPASVAPQYDV
eukprot:tig00000691_g3192.t1